ncbi:hypothetical protein ACIQU3_04510 [Streptomyces sp. NPDC101110]|uniref:hypothetical protein n=1 Tax=unclassified Streptomyces TaxID=2593676 RepID=UPI0038090E4E
MTTATRDLEGLTARIAELAPGLRVETGPGATGAYAQDASHCLGTEAARRVADRVQTFTGALTDLAEKGWTAPPLPENDTSVAVADLALKPRLDRLDGRPVVADGFSCATQIDHLAGERGVRARHLAELLDPAADQPGETT